MIYFITENRRKYNSARIQLRAFDIEIRQKELEIIEPQIEDILKVIKYKADQSYKLLSKPILVADTGVSIPSLGGFPGPFMHFVSKWLSVNDLLNLTRNKRNRRIIFHNVIAYKNKNLLKTFSAKRKGIVLRQKKGKGLPLDQIITFRKDGKTAAECENKGLNRYDSNSEESLWVKFGKWYTKQKNDI